MINEWSKLYVPLKSSQWKISLPIAIQANVCSSQSRTSLVLEVLAAERFLQSTPRSSYWSADKCLNLQAEMNFGFFLNVLASHTVLLFYYFTIFIWTLERKMLEEFWRIFSFEFLILWNFHHSSFSSFALLHEKHHPKHHGMRFNIHNLDIWTLQSEFGSGNSFVDLSEPLWSHSEGNREYSTILRLANCCSSQ